MGRGARFIGILALFLPTCAAPPPSNARGGGPSIPAVFSRLLAPPGKLETVKIPGRIFYEPSAREVFVADVGNNRVLVFDSNGVFRFRFSAVEYLASPMDMAVTPDGRIFLLGPHAGGMRVARFDYDGTFLGAFAPGFAGGDSGAKRKSSEFSSLAADREGHLFLLDETAGEVAVFDSLGRPLRRFPTHPELSGKDRKDLMYGSLSIADTLLYLPVPSLGVVSVYGLDGRRVRDVGGRGNAAGLLGFPVAAAADADGVLHVLDKNRFVVVCYDPEGRFLGEFGGKGFRTGWFYHPTRMAVLSEGRVAIGQVLGGLIQVCERPAFLAARAPALALPADP